MTEADRQGEPSVAAGGSGRSAHDRSAAEEGAHGAPSPRWRRLERLFAAAVDLPPAERSAWLATACADDPGLGVEVAALLAADAEGGVLEDSVARTARSLVDSDPGAGGPDPGRPEPERPTPEAFPSLPSSAVPSTGTAPPRVGPWRLVREIGRGGTSRVFLGERDDGAFEQRVAVKLLLPGFETGELLRRFLHERQIVAGLAHPYVAALLDGGTTEDGRPFVVLEHVEGQPIDTWCDHRRLSVEERLRLFLKVCEAVHAAHRSLVVHRDLKPSNVLVTGDGVPKLLDFGIAKPLEGTADGDLTRTGLRPMTPHYASPEQFRGERVTTASDVYSLGVLLYRLLVGRLPHPRLDGYTGGSLAAWERAVLEGTAERASVAAAREDGGPSPDEIAALRSTTPDLLRRRLAGDLDTVLARTLDPDPERRYGSVLQLAEDLSRHLEGLPVIARPPTLGYRWGKFLRRHRLAAAVIAVALAALLAAAVLLALQARRLAHERDRANQVAELLVDLFAIADPREARAGSITARELLDRGAERVEALEGQPATQARLYGKLAELYEGLGLFPPARELLERAVPLARDGEAGELAGHLNHLGRVLARQGDYAAAEPRFAEALALYESLSGLEGREATGVLNNLALVRHDLGDYAAAAEGYRRVVEVETRLTGAPHPFTVVNHALLLLDLGDYGASATLLRNLVEEERRAGEDPEVLASALELLGLAELGLVERERADGWSPGSGRATAGISSPGVPAAPLLDAPELAHRSRAHLETAEAALLEAVELRRRRFGERHPDTARSLAALGVVARQGGDLERAAELLTESLEIRRQSLGDAHPEVADGLREWATLLARSGRDGEAEAAYRQALGIQERSFSPDHPISALTRAALGSLLARRDDCAAALPLLERALPRVPEGDWRRLEAMAARDACR